MRVTRLRIEVLAVLAGLGALIAMATQLPEVHGLVLANGVPLFGDYLAFWSAGRAVLHGDAAQIYEQSFLSIVQDQALPALTSHLPWRSPPQFLLIATPLALAPYAVSALLFFALSYALYLAGLRPMLPDRRALIVPAAAPGAVLQLGSTQVSLAITGLSGLALAWLEKRPLLAGAAIAGLVIKPHLAVLWPVMLVLQGRWRAFISAAFCVAALTLASGLVFGFDLYGAFLTHIGDAQSAMSEKRIPPQTYASLCGVAIALGASERVAALVHGVSALAALIGAALIFRRNDAIASALALAAGTVLISPYLFFYDSLLLIVGSAALAQRFQERAAVAIMAAGFLAGALQLWIGHAVALPIVWGASWAMLLYAWRIRTPAGSAAASLPA